MSTAIVPRYPAGVWSPDEEVPPRMTVTSSNAFMVIVVLVVWKRRKRANTCGTEGVDRGLG